ncbi:MAG: hypothetical protein EZS28_019111 [Streblomastix strix]|uniref:RNase H type-1 domain-containing protein n=1 Tax=Streblomastix strix TaxID=222440 RepID=A0A5J4VSQ4_9EUKA|nr:MAG: hypothetical protein EZS28_019111 [Streblomastix strix]
MQHLPWVGIHESKSGNVTLRKSIGGNHKFYIISASEHQQSPHKRFFEQMHHKLNGGATIIFVQTGLKEMHEWSWNRDSKLTSSNQREAAAILQGIRRFAMSPRHYQIKALRIETENSSAAFNINRGAEVRSSKKTARHIPGLINQEADQLKSLAASGDYQIREEVLEEALLQFHVHMTIDIFAKHQNRKCRRFCSLMKDLQAVRQDGMALPWKIELPLLHPPIALIQPILNKIMKGEIRAVLITPYWKALQRRSHTGLQNEKEEKTSSSWKTNDYTARGENVDMLYKQILRQRGKKDQSIAKTQQKDCAKLGSNIDNELENSQTTGKLVGNNQLKSVQSLILAFLENCGRIVLVRILEGVVFQIYVPSNLVNDPSHVIDFITF